MSNSGIAALSAAEQISRAAAVIKRGGIVGLPTETVYGLAGDATNPRAVARIYAAKGRPAFNPLITHAASVEEALAHGVFPAAAERLARAFWPGPLTLVVPFRPGSPVCDLARAGLDSIALRVPANQLALAVIAAAGVPLAAPSANRSGRISATSAGDIASELGEAVEFVIDGGRSAIGVESTIVSLLGPQPVCLRIGGLPRAAIEAVTGQTLMFDDGGMLRAPGMLASHYAPAAALRLNAAAVEPGEALLAFGPGLPAGHANAAQVLNLSAKGDTVEAAANLYAMLRKLDGSGPKLIAVAPVPEDGLGEAINDRLRRAAAPR